MNEQDRFDDADDAVDRLVARSLESEQAQVDLGALMAGLGRRRARRRIVRLSVRLCAAAAVVLIAVGLLVNHRTVPVPRTAERPASGDGQAALALQADLVASLRGEVEAALRGARSSGAAAVSAGTAPLMEVAAVNQGLPDLIDKADSALDRLFGTPNPHSDQDREENPQWKL